MNVDTSAKLRNKKSATINQVLKRVLQLGINLLILAAILFLSSGHLEWGMAWAYLSVSVIVLTVNGLVLLKHNPELIVERTQMREGTKGWDKILVGLYGLTGVVTLLICGLDARFRWSPELPLALKLTGLLLFTLGSGLASWAMGANAFFATTVRIQAERGHTVVSEGPYRYVRHPGYSGWALCNVVVPLILSSLWAFIPAGLTVSMLVVRTALEDKTLLEELDGYAEYAQKVRYRLLPGVW